MAPDAKVGEGNGDLDTVETNEWLDALEGVLQTEGPERARFLLSQLKHKAVRNGVEIPFTANTPYINTIPPGRQPLFPGHREIERRIKSYVRWNAMVMVVKANVHDGTLGGVFGKNELPLLAFTIGPKSAMADQMHATKAKFTGPGTYKNVIVMVYLGKTALDDTYGGLGTVTVNSDWRTGSFVLNDKTSAGVWDCGSVVR